MPWTPAHAEHAQSMRRHALVGSRNIVSPDGLRRLRFARAFKRLTPAEQEWVRLGENMREWGGPRVPLCSSLPAFLHWFEYWVYQEETWKNSVT